MAVNICILLAAIASFATSTVSATDVIKVPLQTRSQPILRIPDGQAVLMTAYAEGVQIYVSKPDADPAGATTAPSLKWVLKAPRAVLFDQNHKKIGAHSAGPTWELQDGSKVMGERTPVLRVDAAKASDIAWLLLKAKSHEGSGLLSRVTYVLRVDTSGGVSARPPSSHQGQQETQVRYRATYIFLCAAPEEPKSRS